MSTFEVKLLTGGYDPSVFFTVAVGAWNTSNAYAGAGATVITISASAVAIEGWNAILMEVVAVGPIDTYILQYWGVLLGSAVGELVPIQWAVERGVFNWRQAVQGEDDAGDVAGQQAQMQRGYDAWSAACSAIVATLCGCTIAGSALGINAGPLTEQNTAFATGSIAGPVGGYLASLAVVGTPQVVGDVQYTANDAFNPVGASSSSAVIVADPRVALALESIAMTRIDVAINNGDQMYSIIGGTRTS